MIRPYIDKILVEKVDDTKEVGSFTFDVDTSFCKGKVISIGKPLVSYFGKSEIDVQEGEVVIYKKESVDYSVVENGITLEVVSNSGIICVEN